MKSEQEKFYGSLNSMINAAGIGIFTGVLFVLVIISLIYIFDEVRIIESILITAFILFIGRYSLKIKSKR